MDATPQRPKGRGCTLSTLNTTIEALNLAKEISCITPAKAVFGSVSVLLAMIRDSMINRMDCVELGLTCADVCKVLNRGMNGRRVDQLSQSVFEAIEQLTVAIAEIQRDVIELGRRSTISRLLHAKSDSDTLAAWRSDLNRILHVFNTELAINTHAAVSDIHRTIVERRDGTDRSSQWTRHLIFGSSVYGEPPPPPPRACFGRSELIEKVVGLTENLAPIALIGAGGIGKTSIALAVLHHRRIKERFGDNRRFIRCDQFPASRGNFLNRLSRVIGTGVENPEDLTPLRQSLSSNEMLIVLDNAESILDPQATNALEIYSVVEELSHFDNVCLLITSRITTTPPDCEPLEIPTLSMKAALDTFYRIYKYDGQSESINAILKQLEFHPLSVTLLATVAHQNRWDNNRLRAEWEQRQTDVLQTEHKRSLAATIELSLSSPMFKELGPDARGFLEVVAFFPKGVNESNLDWLFPTFSDATHTFDKFCVLSLTHRSNGFITMLAPLRDYLRPKDPESSTLLCITKKSYFTRMSVDPEPSEPTFGEARWIISEDVNVEHLLDVFMSADTNSDDVLDACNDFMRHLYWHKKRQTVLKQKIERLPDNHPSKPECLFQLARLSGSVGNHVERKELLTRALTLERMRGESCDVARSLEELSDANRLLGLRGEGIQQAKEALEICERLGKITGQAGSLIALGRLLHEDGQLNAAEEAVSRGINLLSEQDQEFRVCRSRRVLGDIYRSKGERGKAIHNFEVALAIASPYSWNHHLFWIHFSLALLFSHEGKFGDAHAQVEKAKPYAVYDIYHLGRAILLQAEILHQQRRIEEATSEALRALEIFERLGATKAVRACEDLLRDSEKELIYPGE